MNLRGAPRDRDVSQRQREAWGLMARGMCDKEIARAMGVCLGTAKIHANEVLRRTGARNRIVAALMWHGIAV